jgi:hypothetical protein
MYPYINAVLSPISQSFKFGLYAGIIFKGGLTFQSRCDQKSSYNILLKCATIPSIALLLIDIWEYRESFTSISSLKSLDPKISHILLGTMFCLSFFAVIVELKNKTNAVDDYEPFPSTNQRQSKQEKLTPTDTSRANALTAKHFDSITPETYPFTAVVTK